MIIFRYIGRKLNQDAERSRADVPSSTRTPIKNLIVLGKLGRGSTSHVFRAQSTKDKQLYAMKVFDKKSSQYRSSALEKEL